MREAVRIAVLLGGGALAVGLIAAVLGLPPPAVDLPEAVAAHMAQSGVEHPVTAVLLNFRGYDTLLEVAVLLLALLGVLTVVGNEAGAPGIAGAPDPVLQTLARLATPLMILAAGYLLWAGAHRPGGAFQAGAILAAAAVLLNLAGVLPAWAVPRFWLRLGMAGGLLIFLALAAGLLGQGALLRYPPEWAGTLILVIEAGLALSLGLILAGLFLLLGERGERR